MYKLINDDCFNILKNIPDNKIDLLVTSPPYYNAREYSQWETVDDYMNDMKALSLYDTQVTANYGDKLLTLSTCDYQEKEGRFVVVAKRVNE